MNNRKDTEGNGQDKVNSKKDIWIPFGVTIVSSIFLCALSFFGNLYINNVKTEIILENIEKNLSEIKSSVSNLEEENYALNERLAYTEATISLIKDSITVSLSSASADKINVETHSLEMLQVSSGPEWSKSDVIGINKLTGVEYSAEDLYNKQILLPYESNGQEVYFLGQFNDNMHWDGNCIINVYEGNKLRLITVANYSDGKLIDYNQVLRSSSEKDGNWYISNRIRVDNYNSGETWCYYKQDDYIKDFDLLSVSKENILTVDKFREINNNLSLEGYYNGNTSDGYYNDTTGNAYLVKFNSNGTVRTLYKGCFANGKFCDDSNDAWYITKDEDTEYMYFKGIFKNGTPKKNKDSEFINPVDEEFIRKIVNDIDIKIELSWEGFSL